MEHISLTTEQFRTRIKRGVAVGAGFIAAGVTTLIEKPFNSDETGSLEISDIVTGQVYFEPTHAQTLGGLCIAAGAVLIGTGLHTLRKMSRRNPGETR